MKEFNFEKELLGVQDELFRFAYKLTANREKAEDLLQDTLLKAMLHKESYNKNIQEPENQCGGTHQTYL